MPYAMKLTKEIFLPARSLMPATTTFAEAPMLLYDIYDRNDINHDPVGLWSYKSFLSWPLRLVNRGTLRDSIWFLRVTGLGWMLGGSCSQLGWRRRAPRRTFYIAVRSIRARRVATLAGLAR